MKERAGGELLIALGIQHEVAGRREERDPSRTWSVMMFRRGGALQGEACSSQMPGSAVWVSAREPPSEGRYKSSCIISQVCADECAKGGTQEEISHCALPEFLSNVCPWKLPEHSTLATTPQPAHSPRCAPPLHSPRLPVKVASPKFSSSVSICRSPWGLASRGSC